jgi:23S rRNA (cytidine1920-2'-O)/16S rRNA (cytidine1409-2'-O)-methyltransferase
MPPKRRAQFVLLVELLRRRYPSTTDPAGLVRQGQVLVDGAPTFNPDARVRADASVRLVADRPLRGTLKLAHALATAALDVRGLAVVDLGAAAGGFTRALLDAGARVVYAVDAGVGQLRGSLRLDPRVVNLERMNLGALGPDDIAEPIDMITADLSYLSLASAIPQFDRIPLHERAQALVLVKPTFELHSGDLAASQENIAGAIEQVSAAFVESGWAVVGAFGSAVPGSRGAREAFVQAMRHRPGSLLSRRSVAGSG